MYYLQVWSKHNNFVKPSHPLQMPAGASLPEPYKAYLKSVDEYFISESETGTRSICMDQDIPAMIVKQCTRMSGNEYYFRTDIEGPSNEEQIQLQRVLQAECKEVMENCCLRTCPRLSEIEQDLADVSSAACVFWQREMVRCNTLQFPVQ